MKPNQPTTNEIQEKDLTPMVDYLNQEHHGNVLSLLNKLDRTIYTESIFNIVQSNDIRIGLFSVSIGINHCTFIN